MKWIVDMNTLWFSISNKFWTFCCHWFHWLTIIHFLSQTIFHYQCPMYFKICFIHVQSIHTETCDACLWRTGKSFLTFTCRYRKLIILNNWWLWMNEWTKWNLTSLCAWIEKCTSGLDCHCTDGAVCYLCAWIPPASITGNRMEHVCQIICHNSYQAKLFSPPNDKDKEKLYSICWNEINLPTCVIALRALTPKISTSDHFFGCALASKATWY